ncbi:MAG: DUF559 domain-containing protein [Solirubrobacterales bacterium]
MHRARSRRAWELARGQYGVVSRAQLLGLGFSAKAIRHRIAAGRLFPLRAGVYGVGHRDFDRKGWWMAAILACGDGACLSHRSAGALYGICEERNGVIEVSVPRPGKVNRPGIKVHRRPSLPSQDVGTVNRIPVTSPVRTMIDLATEQGPQTLLRTINEADKRDVIFAEDLRGELDAYAGQPGVRPLRTLLDRDTFVLSDEELERLFLPLTQEAGLSLPMTKQMVNGYEVDFYWPELKLVVETDGLRYHRTPLAQAKDARRDQTHTAAGYARLRFTHWQVKHERDHVLRILGETASRLGPSG